MINAERDVKFPRGKGKIAEEESSPKTFYLGVSEIRLRLSVGSTVALLSIRSFHGI